MTTLRTISASSQPNANNARASADVLVAWMPDGTKFGKMFGAVSGQATAHYSAAALSTEIGPEGYYITTSATTDNIQCRAYYGPARQTQTWVSHFTLASLAADVDVFSEASNATPHVFITTLGAISVLMGGSGGDNTLSSATGKIGIGTHTIAITLFSATGSELRNVEIWLNGKLIQTGTLNSFQDGFDCAPRKYGSTIHGPSSAMVYLTARVKGIGNAQSLSSNPWQIFDQRTLPIYVSTLGLQESFATYSGVSATSSIGIITAVGDGANGSTALTGIQLSSAVGSLTAQTSATTSITGQQATTGRTAPTATTSAATTITGISVTSGIGALTAQGAAIATLGGVSASSSVGILGVTTSAATTLSGVTSTSNVGIIGASANGSGSTTLVGVTSTNAVGNITAVGTSNATTTISGVLSSSNVGTLNVSVSVATTLGGVGSTASVGVVTGTGIRNASTTLVGQSATSNRGTITAYSSAVVTLNGIVVNTAVGSLNISAGASTTLPSVLANVSVGNVNADGNFPYTISLRYYYSEERNNVFIPDSKNNIFVSDSRTVVTEPSPERNSVFVPASKNNVFAPDSRDVQTIPSPSRNQVFVSNTRTKVFVSPKRDT